MKNNIERRRRRLNNNNRPINLPKDLTFIIHKYQHYYLYTYMTSFSSLALFSSSVSTANLRCLLATTFSSLISLSNSFSSPRFNLLRAARRCFWWSSVSNDFSFPLVVFWISFLHYLFRVLSSAFLLSFHCSSASLKLCLL